jgi:uncharacterized protein YggU (UPF0235/DUF167 family)
MYIHVTVHPESKKPRFEQISDTHFEIWVKEPAERGLVNKKVCSLVRDHFNNPDSSVKIVSGHHHPKKLLSIDID